MSQRPQYDTILGIETSCDETSVAVVQSGAVRSNVIASQLVHSEYGGVVPEMASREHERLLAHITRSALEQADVTVDDLDGVAVTYGPGLMGSLLVGVNFAKGLSLRKDIPLVGVNHIEAHLLANLIDEPELEFPFLCLLVSGGHTQIIRVGAYRDYAILGTTIDDAAGEAFDKVARLLGLGYPGGPYIDKHAAEGDPAKYAFPRSLKNSGDLNFSFSGLKTAALYTIQPLSDEEKQQEVPHLSASFQEAIVDTLELKLRDAVEQTGIRSVTIAGGVAANSRLRTRMDAMRDELNLQIHYPDFQYCTDNGAMIAYAGWYALRNGIIHDLSLTAEPRLSIDSTPVS
mgnify:CR=1 FL=1